MANQVLEAHTFEHPSVIEEPTSGTHRILPEVKAVSDDVFRKMDSLIAYFHNRRREDEHRDGHPDVEVDTSLERAHKEGDKLQMLVDAWAQKTRIDNLVREHHEERGFEENRVLQLTADLQK